jgi:hypothetical protein
MSTAAASVLALLVVLAGGLVIRLVRLRRAWRRERRRAELRAEWGSRLVRPRNLPVCRAYALAMDPEISRSAPIDDHTWMDLDMDAVFAEIDRTRSAAGQLVLCRMLRQPTSDDALLQERDRVATLFERDSGLRETVQLAASRLGVEGGVDGVVSMLRSGGADLPPFQPGLSVMAAAAALSLFAPFVLGEAGILVVATLFAINFVVHQRVRFRYQPEIQALRQIGALLAAARELVGTGLPGLEEHTARLARSLVEVRPVENRVAAFSSDGPGDLLYEYFNVFLLFETRALHRSLCLLPGAAPALMDVFLTLGELDALVAVASFRQGLLLRCTPEFREPTEGVSDLTLEVEDLTHPLLEHPVPNSVRLHRGVLVSGSNTAGKSTFLRALGVNAVLAATLHTCAARRWVGSRFRVLSSLRSFDDLLHGKSHYRAEAERLLEMVAALDGPQPALCLLDELLAGTNSIERRAASFAILRFLAGRNALVACATHDLELAAQLGDVLDSHHFTYQLSPLGMEFDYRLRPGLDPARNAIELLSTLGFPAEIVAGARARARPSGEPELP